MLNGLKVGVIDFKNFAVGSELIDIKVRSEKASKLTVPFVVRQKLANKRSGNAQTKAMSEISGTTAKPWKQKGTGRARQGSKRSVQFVGGRTCHGPTSRSFNFLTPKKIERTAISSVIINKIEGNKLLVFSSLNEQIKTSAAYSLLSKNKIKNIIFICKSKDAFTKLCLRNIEGVKVAIEGSVSVVDLLRFDYVAVDRDVMKSRILNLVI